jgi:hypothetical protein
MKEKKIENITYATVYVANDGTEFNTKEDCAKYERTYACAMKSRLMAMAINENDEENMFSRGSCDCSVIVVIPRSEKDIDTIKQYAIGLSCTEEQVSRQISDADINMPVTITIGYDNEWCYIQTVSSLVDHITNGTFKLIKG